MGTIPAPNIVADAEQIAQNPLTEYARATQLQENQQEFPQEQEQRAQAIEAQKRQFADQDALTKAMTEYNSAEHKPDDIPGLITKNGGSGQAALAAQQHILTLRKTASDIAKQDADTGSAQIATLTKGHEMIGGRLASLKDVPDEQLGDELAGAISEGMQNKWLDPNEFQHGQQLVALARQNPQAARAQLPAYQNSFKTENQIFDEAQKNAKQEQENWTVEPTLGLRINKVTGEQQPISGAAMSPQMMESKYVALQAKKNAGQSLSADDTNWSKAYEKYKTMVPQFTINQNATGAGMIPGAGQPGGEGGAPATIDAVPQSIRGRVKAIVDYRDKLPPAGRSNPVNTAISYWVNKLDPDHDETTFPTRSKLMNSLVAGPMQKTLGATNTALGHIGVLNDAIDALNNTDVPALNAIANKFGLAIGNTPAATFKTIVHRVGPELAAAYIEGGGTEGERGTTAADFSENASPAQLKTNTAITARLLRSKIGATEQDYKATMKRDDFEDRFLTPEAKATLNKLSPQGGRQNGNQSSGHKVGDLIVQNNRTFKVTKVDSNGKALAADPQ